MESIVKKQIKETRKKVGRPRSPRAYCRRCCQRNRGVYAVRKKSIIAVGVLSALSLLSSAAVLAQNYPSKTVRFIVPYTPGGAADILARRHYGVPALHRQAGDAAACGEVAVEAAHGVFAEQAHVGWLQARAAGVSEQPPATAFGGAPFAEFGENRFELRVACFVLRQPLNR